MTSRREGQASGGEGSGEGGARVGYIRREETGHMKAFPGWLVYRTLLICAHILLAGLQISSFHSHYPRAPARSSLRARGEGTPINHGIGVGVGVHGDELFSTFLRGRARFLLYLTAGYVDRLGLVNLSWGRTVPSLGFRDGMGWDDGMIMRYGSYGVHRYGNGNGNINGNDV